MDHAVFTAVVADPAGLEDAMDAAGFTAYSLASRPGGGHDLTLYAAAAGLPEAVHRALRDLGIAVQGGALASTADLLRGHLPEDPIELAPGWWIDPCGRLGADHPGRILRVPPGTAFGDGHHPSTRMAARRLLELAARDGAAWAERRVLDLGCGSGVLGLVAALLGSGPVDLTDIDPEAVAAADALLTAHEVRGHRAVVADLLTGLPGQRYEVLIANLYADLVVEILADPRLTDLVPSGHLVLSGIASAKRAMIENALDRAGFTCLSSDEEAWWCCLVAERTRTAV
ncbi:ribosomal protein L11 methyltransferase [Planctomycetota bacterium]|nr:ribosomal protein L11 methyltransferase [Planctomycetota bacterium]